MLRGMKCVVSVEYSIVALHIYIYTQEFVCLLQKACWRFFFFFFFIFFSPFEYDIRNVTHLLSIHDPAPVMVPGVAE